jgi:hypothetical protein
LFRYGNWFDRLARRNNSKLPPVFSFRVKDAKDNDAITFDTVEYFVRKPPRDQAAEVAIIKRPTFRIGLQLPH